MKKEKQKWNWHHENRFPSITLGFDGNIYNAAIHFFWKSNYCNQSFLSTSLREQVGFQHLSVAVGSKGGPPSGKSTRHSSKLPGFKSRRRRHMWIEFVVGSLLCSERFFSGYSGFPLSSETSISKFLFDQEWCRRRTTSWICWHK